MAQELKLGFGYIPRYPVYSNTVIHSGDIYVYEDYLQGGPGLMPAIEYKWIINNRFSLATGLQYHWTGITIGIASNYAPSPYPQNNNLNLSEKGTSVGVRNFEIPFTVRYVLMKYKGMKLNLLGGIAPVITAKSAYHYDKVPDGETWSEEKVAALNAAITIPKKSYTNYFYGVSLDYHRFELAYISVRNIDSSLSDGYVLYGETYPFKRKYKSNRIALFFTLIKKNDK
ncbi:hypothetical protein FKX85_17990 [Echinicola soli]|uniref:Outer membrane protein beta-barrel domain-containing protein n=1 Tax=Echinicola soli TaxID=2591634 RepID=A0A514CLZ8_9BACT|nr:hypothetical protein [Echinicola soli]QDH80831.1 hypothetical protein FKX85_17990 [Echinicola soli]